MHVIDIIKDNLMAHPSSRTIKYQEKVSQWGHIQVCFSQRALSKSVDQWLKLPSGTLKKKTNNLTINKS